MMQEGYTELDIYRYAKELNHETPVEKIVSIQSV